MIFDVSTIAADLPKSIVTDIAFRLNEHGFGTNVDLGIFPGLIEHDMVGIEREARAAGYRGGPLHWLEVIARGTATVVVYEGDKEVASLFNP